MSNVTQPFHLLVIALAGWLNRHQQSVIDYLIEENRVLKQQLEGQRLRFTDARNDLAACSSFIFEPPRDVLVFAPYGDDSHRHVTVGAIATAGGLSAAPAAELDPFPRCAGAQRRVALRHRSRAARPRREGRRAGGGGWRQRSTVYQLASLAHPCATRHLGFLSNGRGCSNGSSISTWKRAPTAAENLR